MVRSTALLTTALGAFLVAGHASMVSAQGFVSNTQGWGCTSCGTASTGTALPAGARIISSSPLSSPSQIVYGSPANTAIGAGCPTGGCQGTASGGGTVIYGAPVGQSQYGQPTGTWSAGRVSAASQGRVRGAAGNVLASLNAQRARQGLRGLQYDPQLQAVAARRAQQMAATGNKNHPPGSFSPGRYEGVGWSSSFSPSGVSACYTSDPRMSVAGAAMAQGRDGVYFCVVYR